MSRAIVQSASLVLGLSLAAPAAHANTPQECISLWAGLTKSNQTHGVAQQDFMAACLAHRPPSARPLAGAPALAPADATGRCRDGSYTAAAVPLAGCNRHGGVAALLGP